MQREINCLANEGAVSAKPAWFSDFRPPNPAGDDPSPRVGYWFERVPMEALAGIAD